jgi:hypothetical protein
LSVTSCYPRRMRQNLTVTYQATQRSPSKGLSP